MSLPTPNSPEFGRLTTGQQRLILEQRAIEAGVISYADLFAQTDDDDESKPLWPTAAAETKALKRWQDGEKTPAYTSVERALKNIAIRREQEDQ